jgi:hypothetical protein
MNRKGSALSALSLAVGVAIAGCAKEGSITDSPTDYMPKPMLARTRVVAVPDTSTTPVADSELTPVSDPNFVPIGAPAKVIVMNRQGGLAADLTVSAVIGPKGGELRLKDAGLRLTIPRGAVSEPTTFSVTAVAGSVVAYEFEPHGTSFPVPLITQQTIFNSGPDSADPNTYNFQAGHFLSRDDLDGTAELGVVNETLPTRIDKGKGKVTFSVTHFSGYLLASGKEQTQSTPTGQ